MNEKTQDNKKQFYAIDIIKFVFAFIVVAAHMFPFSSYSEKGDFLLVQGLARIILPFFFITAAFLFFRYSNISLKEDPVLKKRLWRYIERMSILFFFWSLVINLFLALGWLLYGVKAGVFQLLRSFFLPVGYALVINDTLFQVLPFSSAWRLASFKTFLFHLIQPFNQYHLWYFPALIFGLLFIYLLFRYVKPVFVLSLSMALFVLGSLADSYYGATASLPWLHKLTDIYLKMFETSRNGIFYGILFLAIGAFLARRPLYLKAKRARNLFILFFIGLFVESGILKYYSWQRDYNFLYTAIPAAIFLFLWLKEVDLKEAGIYRKLREASVLIYCSHGLFVILVPVLFNIFGFGSYIENSMVKFWLVFVITAAFSWAILWLEKFPRLKLLRYLH